MTNQTLMAPGDPNPHFVLVPLMAQGHMIPMTDLAQLLAERGALVTFITTPFNAARIAPTIDRLTLSNLPIRFVELRFPCAEAGLPDGTENIDVLPSGDLAINFFKATTVLKRPLIAHLQETRPGPDCIISDSNHPWTREVARALHIPRLDYWGICCFTLLSEHNLSHAKIREEVANDAEPFLVPGLADRVEVTKAQAPGWFPGAEWASHRDEMQAAEEESEGIVVNTFHSLEPWYVENYGKALGKKVWAVGPVSLYNRAVAVTAARGNKSSIDKDKCLRWLDSMKPKSVVYVSFGSLAYVPPAQLVEIGLGLEAVNCPFILVIKESENSPQVKKWREEFERRTSLGGLVIVGWAPQLMILSHPAVGGFMTHCGWNSTMEGICAGVPMITWPSWGDQFLNERLIVDVLRIGVMVGVIAPPSSWGVVEENQVMVKKEEVERAVRCLMDEGEEGAERRERVRGLGEKARKAMEQGGSSYVDMTLMIEHISQLKRGKVQRS